MLCYENTWVLKLGPLKYLLEATSSGSIRKKRLEFPDLAWPTAHIFFFSIDIPLTL